MRNLALFFIGPILLSPFFLFAFGYLDLFYFCIALGLAIYVCLLIVNFEAGFLVLIFVRSSLDYLKQSTGEEGFNLAAIFAVGLIVLSFFHILYRKVDIFRYKETAPFLIFLAACGISTVFSDLAAESFADWLRLLSIFSVYVITRATATTEKKIRIFLIVILLSSIFPLYVALIQFFTGASVIGSDFEYGRLQGTFAHPNAFSSYLLVILIFTISQIFERKPLINRFILFPYVICVSTVFLLTFSRGAWIVFVVSVVLMGLMRYRRILAIVPVVLFVLVFIVPSVSSRVADEGVRIDTKHPSSWEWRLMAWSNVAPLFREKPLFGHGLSTIDIELGYQSHNDFLRLLAETGAVGFLAYLYLIYRLVRVTWGDYRRARDDLTRGFQVGLLALIIGFVIREAADNTLRNTVVMVYFWFFIAVVRNMINLEAKDKPVQQAS